MSPRFVGLRGLLLLPLAPCSCLPAARATAQRPAAPRQAHAREPLRTRPEALRASNYDEAVRIYEALTARYPFTPQSRQARLDIIYAYYKLGEKESAKDAAETFIRENPTHPRIDYAWYLKGLIDFERMPHRARALAGRRHGGATARHRARFLHGTAHRGGALPEEHLRA